MRTVKGEIEFKKNKIDVTDPCYDSDVWCRKQVFITPGKYIYTVKLEQEQNCEIVSQLKIQLKNFQKFLEVQKPFSQKGFWQSQGAAPLASSHNSTIRSGAATAIRMRSSPPRAMMNSS